MPETQTLSEVMLSVDGAINKGKSLSKACWSEGTDTVALSIISHYVNVTLAFHIECFFSLY